MKKKSVEVKLLERGQEPFGLAAMHGSKVAQDLYQKIGLAIRGPGGGEIICALTNVLVMTAHTTGADPAQVIQSLISTWRDYNRDFEKKFIEKEGAL